MILHIKLTFTELYRVINILSTTLSYVRDVVFVSSLYCSRAFFVTNHEDPDSCTIVLRIDQSRNVNALARLVVAAYLRSVLC